MTARLHCRRLTLGTDPRAEEGLDQAVDAAIAAHAHEPGGLMPLLHAIQDRVGYVPPSALPRIARALHLSAAEVQGVVSFYHHFRSTPPGRHTLQVCRAEACQAMGSDTVAGLARSVLGVDWHGTSADGAWTLEPVYCLGNCACAPSVMVDRELHGRIDEPALRALLASSDGGAR